MAKIARTIYTEEQKSEARTMVKEGFKPAVIAEKTGIAISTVNKIVAEVKSGNKASNSSTSTSFVASVKAELQTIQKRKSEIEALLNGKLKKELESLSNKETALEDLLTQYNFNN